jgi:hypothetical protein
MRPIFLLLFFINVHLNLFSQTKIDSYITSLKNIINFDTPGYQDIVNDFLTNRRPYSLNEFARGYFSIRPYDIFIKVYEKNSNEEYYTRCTSMDLQDGFIYFNPNFIINLINIPSANRFRIIKRDTEYFLQFQYMDMIIPKYVDDSVELNIVDEFEIMFYKPIGRIVKNIDNIFFQFESIEEVQGGFEYDVLDLSNIDLKKEIMNLHNHIDNLESAEIKNKYIEKINFALYLINNNLNNVLYSPPLIKSIISQFYNIEILNEIQNYK